ncbi:MAG: ABC transporter permease, partial [Ignavibacteria bacterium]
MFINYIKMIIRNIWGNKGYALITTLGLSIGITAFILISFYVNYELSYDTYNENYDNIYRVATKFVGHTHAGVDKLAVVRSATGPAMVSEMPEVISCFRIRRLTDKFLVVDHTKYSEPILYYSDPQIFDILSLKVKYGSFQNALKDPNSIVISEKAAKKYFGNINPVGKTISYGGEDDFYVTAVMEDMPINSHFRTDVFLPMIYYAKKFDVDLSSWFESSCWTYILTDGTTSIEGMNKKLAEIAPKELLEGHHGHSRSMFVQKLGDIHVKSHADYELEANNDINTIYLFALIGLLILLIGGLNYVNLTTARSIKRAKEVGIRKTFGAGKKNIIKQFLFESISVAFLSLFIAVLILVLVLPYFNSYVEREFTFSQFLTPTFIAYTFAAILIIGFLAGSFPAFIISSFKPVSIFSNKFEQGNKGFATRNIFILLQFSIAIILIICTVVIENQLSLISSMNMGYSRDQIVNIEVKSDKVWDKLDVIKNELKKNHNVLMVSSSTYLPNEILDQTAFRWPGKDEDIEIRTYTTNADYNWVDLFGIEIIEGRNFSRNHLSDASGAFLLNETAVKSLNWDNVVGRELIHWTGKQGKIVGVMKDFNLHTIHREIEPLYVFYEPTERHYYLSVKISGNNIPR